MWNSFGEENLHGENPMERLSFSINNEPQMGGGGATGVGPSVKFKNLAFQNSGKTNSFQQMLCDEDEMSFFNDDAVTLQQEPDLPFQLNHEQNQLLSENSTVRFAMFEPNSNEHWTNEVQQSNRSSTNFKSFRVFNSLSSESMESSIDDDYMDLFEMESLEDQRRPQDVQSLNHLESSFKLPSNLSSLFSGRIQTSSSPNAIGNQNSNLTLGTAAATPMTAADKMKTPEMRRPSVRRCLSMTENNLKILKTPEQSSSTPKDHSTGSSHLFNNCFKRPDPPSLTCSPVQSKRYRFQEKENISSALSSGNVVPSFIDSNGHLSTIKPKTNIHHPPLRKCMSMNDAEIMSALARSDNKDQPDLIGDFSGPFALPIMEGRHRDLKSISSHTVARLLNGEFNDQIASFQIIDCRYPYEFEGGHIRGAKNLYTQEQIIDEFLNSEKNEEKSSDPLNKGRNIIIFHCEFSSERGPKLSRFLRNNDRARNTSSYPALDYPEIYLLHNGYKEFYEIHAELCDPIAYRPMLEPAYNEAYRHFRAKSKSWNGDGFATGGSGFAGYGGYGSTRFKKSRPRLLL